MITQGFPLYAVESGGTTYAVVGWDKYQYPFLLALDLPGAAARNPLEHETFTYTTTDPTAQAFSAELISTEPDSDLRQRLNALADEIERRVFQQGPQWAEAIRRELAK